LVSTVLFYRKGMARPSRNQSGGSPGGGIKVWVMNQQILSTVAGRPAGFA
jgi:hypothetical protein